MYSKHNLFSYKVTLLCVSLKLKTEFLIVETVFKREQVKVYSRKYITNKK